MSFDAIEFPLNFRRCLPSVGFSTSIVELGGGAEQRLALWQDARVRFNAALGARSLKDLQRLISFHRARKGRARGFLVWDLSDHAVDAGHAPEGRFATGDGTTAVFQLSKTYFDDWNADVRPISKPKVGTVKVYQDGVVLTEGSHYTVNYASGLVSFASAPASGAVLEWSGEFFLPVRFEQDEIDYGEFAYLFEYQRDTSDFQPVGAAGEMPVVAMREVRDVLPVYDPREVRGARYLWAADALPKLGLTDGGNIATWTDRISGIVLSGGASNPVYRKNGVNAYHAAHFGGAAWRTATVVDLPDAATIICAGRVEGAGNVWEFSDGTSAVKFSLYAETPGRVVARAKLASGDAFVFRDYAAFSGLWGVFTVRLGDGRLTLRWNGQVIAQAAATGALDAINRLTLGAGAGGSGIGTARIGALSVNAAALTDAETIALERVLAYQYGVVIS